MYVYDGKVSLIDGAFVTIILCLHVLIAHRIYWVIIKIHVLFPVHFLVTSNIFFHVLLKPFSFAYITIIYSHNMQSGKPPWQKLFQDIVDPLIPFRQWCYQHEIILCRKINIIFMYKVVKYIIYREIIHNLGYFLWNSISPHNIWKCSCGVPFNLHYETNKFS